MTLSHRLKLYPNEAKKKKLNALISFYRDKVNKGINNLWPLGKKVLKMKYPKYEKGDGRFGIDADKRALAIVKGARETKSNKPIFKGFEIDMNSAGIKLTNFRSKEFDLWFCCQCINKGHRLMLPAKRTQYFNVDDHNAAINILRKSTREHSSPNKLSLTKGR